MDAWFGVWILNRQALDNLEFYQENFKLDGVEYPEEDTSKYFWGKYFSLVEESVTPTKYILKMLPLDYRNQRWIHLLVNEKGRDLLDTMINTYKETDWEEKTLDSLLRTLLTPQDKWVVIFAWHWDEINTIYNLNIDDCINLFKNNLKWGNNREGFIVFKKN